VAMVYESLYTLGGSLCSYFFKDFASMFTGDIGMLFSCIIFVWWYDQLMLDLEDENE
jgi:hypothetical protein